MRFARALDVIERAVGRAHPRAADALDGLGRVALRRGDYALARERFERSLAVREQALGATHPHVARSLLGLSDVAAATGDDKRARELRKRREAILGRAERTRLD